MNFEAVAVQKALLTGNLFFENGPNRFSVLVVDVKVEVGQTWTANPTLAERPCHLITKFIVGVKDHLVCCTAPEGVFNSPYIHHLVTHRHVNAHLWPATTATALDMKWLEHSQHHWCLFAWPSMSKERQLTIYRGAKPLSTIGLFIDIKVTVP
jgi:hypothetical protein